MSFLICLRWGLRPCYLPDYLLLWLLFESFQTSVSLRGTKSSKILLFHTFAVRFYHWTVGCQTIDNKPSMIDWGLSPTDHGTRVYRFKTRILNTNHKFSFRTGSHCTFPVIDRSLLSQIYTEIIMIDEIDDVPHENVFLPDKRDLKRVFEICGSMAYGI